jgi:hypothetical protein
MQLAGKSLGGGRDPQSAHAGLAASAARRHSGDGRACRQRQKVPSFHLIPVMTLSWFDWVKLKSILAPRLTASSMA